MNGIVIPSAARDRARPYNWPSIRTIAIPRLMARDDDSLSRHDGDPSPDGSG